MPDALTRPPRGLLLALALALVVRAVAFPLSLNHYGDAPVRAEIAERWAASPHVIRGFNEVYQFGPVHIYALGVAMRLVPDRDLASRGLSFLLGLLGIAALYALARRLEGDDAATLAACALALHGLHVQASVSAASEAVFLALLCASLERFFATLDSATPRAQLANAALAGALFSLAEGVRYDAWMQAPIAAAILLFHWRRGRVTLAAAATFGVLAAAFPLAWLASNAASAGSALAPLKHIDADHLALAGASIARMGRPLYALFCLQYWPSMLALTATPIVAGLAVAGAVDAFRKREHVELVLLAWLPPAYMTLRGAVLQDFRPLARFTLTTAALTVPFAWRGLQLIAPRARRAVLAAGAALAVAMPVSLALASAGRNGSLAEWARPISPLSTVPPGIAEAAGWLREHHTERDVLLVDGVWDYLDIPLVFYAGFPEDRVIRRAWTNFEAKLAVQRPTLVVAIYQGDLASTPGVSLEGDVAVVRGRGYHLVAKFVYATIYRADE